MYQANHVPAFTFYSYNCEIMSYMTNTDRITTDKQNKSTFDVYQSINQNTFAQCHVMPVNQK